MKCYVISPSTGQPCDSEEHLAKDCPFNTQGRSTVASTNLATDMRTPTLVTPSWGPEYVSSSHDPVYMIVVEGSDSSDDDNEGQSNDHAYPSYGRVRQAFLEMGLDADDAGYDADPDNWSEASSDTFADLPPPGSIPSDEPEQNDILHFRWKKISKGFHHT